MTSKNFLGLLYFGLALSVSTPVWAGWGSSFGGSSYGSGGSHGSYGSRGGGHGHHHRSFSSYGGSTGSFGSTDSGVVHASTGGSGGSGGSYASTGGSTGSYASSGGSWGGSSGGNSGLFHGGLINKLRAHHHRKMAWLRSRGSSGGSSGGSTGGSSGGSWGSYSNGSHASSGGSWGGSYYGGSSGTVSSSDWNASEVITSEPMMSFPVEEAYPIESTPTEAAPLEADSPDSIPVEPLDPSSASMGKGTLQVSLPADAKLFVNGARTTSTGKARQFVSKGLKAGYKYPYEVKAVLKIDGQEIVKTETVSLRAGAATKLSFDFAPVDTELTIRLPENASLTLAGSKTRSTGSVRKFVTKKLAAGQLWSDYTVVVSFDQDGRTVSKEQTIDLRGGEGRTLLFDFDQQVASR